MSDSAKTESNPLTGVNQLVQLHRSTPEFREAPVCCELTAPDASTVEYRVIVVGDAKPAVADEMHKASSTTVYRGFGYVRSTDEVLMILGSE